ncbi:MAG: TonB-dependent receptor [Chitinophagales bacterium]
MKYSFKLFLLLVLIYYQFGYSQSQNNIQIKVSDKKSKELLFGANVQYLRSTIGATTNEFGIVVLEQSDTHSDSIVISYIGYLDDTVSVKNKTNIDIQLQAEILLSEVKIRSKRKTNFISSIDPMKTEKIESSELKKAACCNLSESFQTNASVDVNYSDAVTGAKEIKLLGLSGLYVQNLLEGVPFMRGLTATYGLDHVPSPWMKSISVSKGMPTVKNSYEGISGSMNIEYKNSFNDSIRLYIDLFGNSDGRIETNLIINHKINPKLGTVLMANGAFRPFEMDNNKDGFLDQPKIKQYNLLNRWNYHGDKVEGQYMVKVLSENRIAGQTVKHIHHADSLPLYNININTKRMEAFAKTGYLFSEENSLGTQFSGIYHQQRSNFGKRNFDTRQASFTGTILYQTTVKNDNHSLVGGANFVYDNLNEKSDSLQFRHQDFVPGIFVEYTFKYKDKITLVAGLRADYHSRAGFQYAPRVHARFLLAKNTTLRIAAGRGFRVPNVLTENQSLLASSRKFVFLEIPTKEIACNYGISFNQKFYLKTREGSFNVDFYRTDFTQQAIIDIDNADGNINISNLHGKSFSNSLLVEFNCEMAKGFDVKLAYKFEDVRSTYRGMLLQKALLPQSKGLVALSYKTPNEQWQFDANLAIQGKRRLPNSFTAETGKNMTPIFATLNAQITKYFKYIELFIGAENITNYKQKNPILGTPFSAYFDTNQIYAPIMGATAYGGFRVSLND